jgi:hypothetical protein
MLKKSTIYNFGKKISKKDAIKIMMAMKHNRELFILLNNMGLASSVGGGSGLASSKTYVQTYLPYMPSSATTTDNVTFVTNWNQSGYPGTNSTIMFLDEYIKFADIPATVNGSPISLLNPFRFSFFTNGLYEFSSCASMGHDTNYTYASCEAALCFLSTSNVANAPWLNSTPSASPANTIATSWTGTGFTLTWGNQKHLYGLSPWYQEGGPSNYSQIEVSIGGYSPSLSSYIDSYAKIGVSGYSNGMNNGKGAVYSNIGGTYNNFNGTWGGGTQYYANNTANPGLTNYAITVEYYSQVPVNDLQTPYMSIYFHFNVTKDTKLKYYDKPSGLFYQNSTANGGYDCGYLPLANLDTNVYRLTFSKMESQSTYQILPYFGAKHWGAGLSNSILAHNMTLVRMPIYYGW